MIRIQGLNKFYNPGQPNEFKALKGIDLEVAAGELLMIAGVSGSGKTTLLSIIGALSKPTSGLVEVAGQQVAKLPDLHASRFRADTIGFIFQNHNLFTELSVKDNVMVPLVPAGLKQKVADARVQSALVVAGIDHKARQKVADLSGGEKQRCAIARALVTEPTIILCDEPTANLDRENALKFIEILRQLKSLGKTILVATHDDLLTGLDFIDRTVHLQDGSIAGP